MSDCPKKPVLKSGIVKKGNVIYRFGDNHSLYLKTWFQYGLGRGDTDLEAVLLYKNDDLQAHATTGFNGRADHENVGFWNYTDTSQEDLAKFWVTAGEVIDAVSKIPDQPGSVNHAWLITLGSRRDYMELLKKGEFKAFESDPRQFKETLSEYDVQRAMGNNGNMEFLF